MSDWLTFQFQGAYGLVEYSRDGKYIRKSYKEESKHTPLNWQNEKKIQEEMSAAEIGPHVYDRVQIGNNIYDSTANDIIMDKYDTDVFSELRQIHNDQYYKVLNILPKNAELRSRLLADINSETKRKISTLQDAISTLINKIADYYVHHPDVALCFGDFRFVNIVLKKSQDSRYVDEARQIDFDQCRKHWNNNGNWSKEDIVRLYKLRLALVKDKRFWIFPNGIMFSEEILNEENEYKEVYRKMWNMSVRDKQIHGNMVTLTLMMHAGTESKTSQEPWEMNWENFLNLCRGNYEKKSTHEFFNIIAGKAILTLPLPLPLRF